MSNAYASPGHRGNKLQARGALKTQVRFRPALNLTLRCHVTLCSRGVRPRRRTNTPPPLPPSTLIVSPLSSHLLFVSPQPSHRLPTGSHRHPFPQSPLLSCVHPLSSSPTVSPFAISLRHQRRYSSQLSLLLLHLCRHHALIT